MKKTWPYITLNHDCLIFKKINGETKCNNFQHMSLFSFFPCPIFCLDRPCGFSI